MTDLEPLLARFRHGDRTALARLLSLLARGQHTQTILTSLPTPPVDFRTVAMTGSAGVGKSTLIGKVIEEIRQQGRKVAVLACDPQSSVSGGALLGDRFRMAGRADDDGVFIRSLAAPSGRGGVAAHVKDMIRLLAAFGFDLVLIETVGAGQGDVTVAELADIVVLLLQPETGDDLQWEKAGVLEVADLIAVQKADLPQAGQVAAQVRATLHLSSGPAVPVLLVSAKTGQGVAELWQAIATCAPRRPAAVDPYRQLLQLAEQLLAERLADARTRGQDELAELVRRWQARQLNPAEAGQAVLQLLAAGNSARAGS